MSMYRRMRLRGGTFFFTVTLADRTSSLLVDHIDRLRDAFRIVRERRPFVMIAVCVLPDHLHAIWELPEGDMDFSTRWSAIKSQFSRGLSPSRVPTQSKLQRRERGIWRGCRRRREVCGADRVPAAQRHGVLQEAVGRRLCMRRGGREVVGAERAVQ